MPTHGSLAKAGKVRSQTPKISATEKEAKTPRSRNRSDYDKRVILPRKPRQNWSKSRRYRRR